MKKKCFVAMPFDESFDKLYRLAIKEAITEAGYECLRADELACGGNILNNIVQNIDRAHFVIVDMSSLNPNVMYELGLSHALRKNVILLINDNTKVPTDLSSYFIIRYHDPNDRYNWSHIKNKIIESIHSFEQGTIDFGNPVIDHLRKNNQDVEKLQDEKNEAAIEQKKARKLEFKYIGQRQP